MLYGYNGGVLGVRQACLFRGMAALLQ